MNLNPFDEIISGLLAQQDAVQQAARKACKDRLRFILNKYGYEITVQMLDEVHAEEFAKAEIASRNFDRQWGI